MRLPAHLLACAHLLITANVLYNYAPAGWIPIAIAVPLIVLVLALVVGILLISLICCVQKEGKPCNKLKLAEECTEHGDRCRPVDAVQRSSGNIQRNSRLWLQHSANSPTRATSEVARSCIGMFTYTQVIFTGNFVDCTCTQYCSVALIESMYLLTCMFGCM